jgi:flagellar biosynthetic protein FlhB
VLLITLIAALGAPLSLGGWSFSPSAMGLKFSRLDPIAGFRRMLSLRSLVELGKSLAKFMVVAAAAAIFLSQNLAELLGLGGEPIDLAIAHSMSMTGEALIALTCALVLIAAVDVPFQLWQYHQDLRMTREEIRQESKEDDGSPEMKGRIRTLQRQMAERRMMTDVPKADVIVVNPTHYAVALRYDDKKMRAPTVVAKGVDLMAARIREVASEHKVPIFEAPPLARALHRNVDIGNEIPAGLYVAVAQVLTYIFQLRTARRDHLAPPPLPNIETADL